MPTLASGDIQDVAPGTGPAGRCGGRHRGEGAAPDAARSPL